MEGVQRGPGQPPLRVGWEHHPAPLCPLPWVPAAAPGPGRGSVRDSARGCGSSPWFPALPWLWPQPQLWPRSAPGSQPCLGEVGGTIGGGGHEVESLRTIDLEFNFAPDLGRSFRSGLHLSMCLTLSTHLRTVLNMDGLKHMLKRFPESGSKTCVCVCVRAHLCRCLI